MLPFLHNYWRNIIFRQLDIFFVNMEYSSDLLSVKIYKHPYNPIDLY